MVKIERKRKTDLSQIKRNVQTRDGLFQQAVLVISIPNYVYQKTQNINISFHLLSLLKKKQISVSQCTLDQVTNQEKDLLLVLLAEIK